MVLSCATEWRTGPNLGGRSPHPSGLLPLLDSIDSLPPSLPPSLPVPVPLSLSGRPMLHGICKLISAGGARGGDHLRQEGGRPSEIGYAMMKSTPRRRAVLPKFLGGAREI